MKAATKPTKPAGESVRDHPEILAINKEIADHRAEIELLKAVVLKLESVPTVDDVRRRAQELTVGKVALTGPIKSELLRDIKARELLVEDANLKYGQIVTMVSGELLAADKPDAIRHSELTAAVAKAAAALKAAFAELLKFQEDLQQRGIQWRHHVALQITEWPESRRLYLRDGALDKIAEQFSKR